MRRPLVALLILATTASAIQPTFVQILNLVNDESAPGVQTVGGFITALLDGDAGGDGFTGTAADAVVVNVNNPGFFAVLPTVSVPVGGAAPPGAAGPVGCDPAPGCALTLTYELAPYASGVVTFQVQITDAAGEAAVLQTTTLTVNEVNNAPLPSLASGTGLPATPVTVAENAGPQAAIALLTSPIPQGPPLTIVGTAPFGQEAMQTIASITCVPTNPTLFAPMGGPTIDLTTGDLSFTPQRNRVGTSTITCTVLDSADDPLTTNDDGSITFTLTLIAGQDCADGQPGAVACDGTHQTCFDDGMPDGDDTLNNDFVCVCNNGGQRASRQAAPLCDDCAAGSAGDTACTDIMMPPRWRCHDPDPSVANQGTFTCLCSNGGGTGTPPASCDDCAVAATTGTAACGATSYCRDPDNGDPGQQGNFECVCNNEANIATPTANAAPGMTDCDDCTTLPCGVGQTCSDPDNGSPTSQFNFICTCDVTMATSMGAPAAVCDDCAPNPGICGVGQTCIDPDTSPAAQSNYICQCDNGGGQGMAAPAMICDDCVMNPCTGTQLCADPDTSSATLNDFTCTCNNGIDYMGAGVATGVAAVCPLPPTFTPGGTIRVSEELSKVYIEVSDRWVDGPGFAGYSEIWATGVSDGEVETQGREFRITALNGTGVAAGEMFTQGPYISPDGRLSFHLAPDVWGTGVFEVVLVDSGVPSGGVATSPMCLNGAAWCRSGFAATLVIEVVPDNDPPSFNCTERNIVVAQDVGMVLLGGWAVNISAGRHEALVGLEFRTFNNNEGLFATQPHVTWVENSTIGDFVFEPLPGAEGEAEIEVQLWDLGQDVDGSVRRQTATCNLIRIEVLNVNDKPSFADSGAIVINEDSGVTTHSWATSITAGRWTGSKGDQPGNDATSPVSHHFVVAFTDDSDRPKLTSPPTIHPITGDITLHPAPDQNTYPNTPITLNVTLVDSAGLESTTHQLDIFITPQNDPATFTPGSSVVTVPEDFGLYNESWATGVSVGPILEGVNGEGQVAVLVVNILDQGEVLFTPGNNPKIDENGVLTFETMPESHGEVLLEVAVYDEDPVTGVRGVGEVAFLTLRVEAVNDPPGFSISQKTVSLVKGSGPAVVSGFLTGINPGPADESGQTLTFDVTTNDSTIFTEPPKILYTGGSRGDLVMTPSATAGVSNVTIRVSDNGGGVSDSFVDWFLVAVTGANSEPSFLKGQDVTIHEDQCSTTPCEFPNWAAQISPGDGEATTQPVTFQAVPHNAALFATTPTITDSNPLTPTTTPPPGTLTIHTAANSSGATLIVVTATDNGIPPKSTPPQTFVVKILPVNDPPSFTVTSNLTLDECVPGLSQTCVYTYPGWVGEITPGPPDESAQNIIFTVETPQPGLFETPPVVDPETGTLRFKLAAYQNTAGSLISVLVTGCDTGGTANGGSACTQEIVWVMVGSVDSPPRFSPGEDVIVLEDEGVVRRQRWAVNTTLGRSGGVANTGRVVIGCTPDYPGLFEGEPSVVLPEGDLTFVTADDQHGDSLITCAFGPTGSLGTHFLVTILSVNDRPTFTLRNLTIPVTNLTSNGIVLVTDEQQALFDPNLFWADGVTGAGANVVPFPGVVPGTNFVPGKGGSLGVVEQFASNYVISGQDIVVLENWDGSHPGYIVRYIEPTTLSAGADDEEASQTLNFEVSCGNEGLFASAPIVTPGGLMMFHLSPKTSGTAFCSILLRDDGGSDRGGIPTSHPLNFALIVLNVNNPPQFIRGPNIVVLEDSGGYSAPWAASITPGASDEAGQHLYLTASNLSDPNLFTYPPTFQPWPDVSTLTFTPGVDDFGEVTAVVQATDSGGAVSSAVELRVTILPVNDPPRFQLLTPKISIMEDSGYYTHVVVADVSPGPGNEVGSQSVVFEVEVIGGGLEFAEVPRITLPEGVMSFLVEKDVWGVGVVMMCLVDDGGTENGGVDRVCEQIEVEVHSVNDPPVAVTSGPITVYEDAGMFTVSNWLSSLSPGPDNEAGSGPVTLKETTCPNTPVMFSTQPVVSWPDGDVSFTTSPDAFGVVNCTVTVEDATGISSQIPLQITVLNVNDPPSFTPIITAITVEEDAAPVTRLCSNRMSSGPDNEMSDELQFILTPVSGRVASTQRDADPIQGHTMVLDPFSTEKTLFTLEGVPRIDGEGTLQFTVQPDVYGTITYNVVLKDSGGTRYNGADRSTPETLKITISPVNDPPTWTTSHLEIFFDEDQHDAVVNGWAVGSAGPLTESWQDVQYVVSWPVSNGFIFNGPPAVHGTTGDLIVRLNPDQHGDAVFKVKAVDTAGGESTERDVKITVRPVNDPPCVKFGVGGGIAEILEDTTVLLPGFVEVFDPVEPVEVVKILSTIPDDARLVPELTLFTDKGLYIRGGADLSGETTAWTILQDDGGTANNGVDTSHVNFTIRILPVNDPPTFSVYKSILEVQEDCGVVEVVGVVGNPSPGPVDEAWQVVTYRVTSTPVSGFNSTPVVTPLGTLRFTPSPDFYGTATISVQACDDGGDVNGGQPCSTFQKVVVEIHSVNDPPTFTPGRHDVHVSSNIVGYVEEWARDVSAGPIESNQGVSFRVRNVENRGLFTPDGGPVLDANGTLRFVPNPAAYGVSEVTVFLVDEDGAVSPDYIFVIHIYKPEEAPIFATIDGSLEEFSSARFETTLETALKLPPGCVKVLEAAPGSVNVLFHFPPECGSDLNEKYLEEVARPGSNVRLGLKIIDTYHSGGNGSFPTPEPGSGSDGVSPWVWGVIAAGIVLFLAGIAGFLIRRKMVNSRREERQRKEQEWPAEPSPPRAYFSQPPSDSTIPRTNPIPSTFTGDLEMSDAGVPGGEFSEVLTAGSAAGVGVGVGAEPVVSEEVIEVVVP